ncbi:MAG TPA: ABC transporter substrate-binding protein [Acidimicrobiia bacterium]|nr:ABC transporter substrate-binding protein [Acidimicrobiia bacterium]
MTAVGCPATTTPQREHAARTRAFVALLLVLAVVATACGMNVNAAGEFKARRHDTLTVATGEVPLTGLWEGTAAHPTGGFEYELARALAKHFGLKHLDVVVVPFSRLVQGDLGGADLALSDMTATAARERFLDFTNPYLRARPAVLVRNGRDVPDLHAAQGLSWAVGGASTLHDYLDDTISPDGPVLLTSSLAQTVTAIDDGRVDAGLLDLPVAAAVARASHGQLSVAGQFQKNDDVSAALPNDSPNVDAVSSALRALIADGTVSSLARRWLGLTVKGTSAVHVPLIRTES